MSRKRTTPRPTTKGEAGGIRERILNAAVTILREEGIQGLSQVQVAREAKVRQSHLTYYFPKRHDLVQAVAERFVDGMLHDAGEAAAAGDVGAMLQRIAAAVADQGHMRMFTGVIVEADGDPGLRSILVRLALRLQSTLAERLGGEHAMERAGHVLASLWGLGLYDFMVRPGRGSAFTASFLAALAKSQEHAAPAGQARRRPR